MINCNNCNGYNNCGSSSCMNTSAVSVCDCGCSGCGCSGCGCGCGCGDCATYTVIKHDTCCADCGCGCTQEASVSGGCTGTAWTSERCGM